MQFIHFFFRKKSRWDMYLREHQKRTFIMLSEFLLLELGGGGGGGGEWWGGEGLSGYEC